MRFAEPMVLWALAGVPLLALLMAVSIVRRRRALEILAGRALLDRMVTQVSVHRRILKACLALAGAIFLILALARPQWGMSPEPVTRRGVDVVLAVDVSSSMLAEDIRPSRLDKARSDATRLLDLLKGDRVAVVAFAGSAATLCPLTLDHGAARLFIDALSPDILGEPGTSFPTAMAEIASAYDQKERRFRTAVIFSDGEDQEGGLDRAISDAADAGIIIHTVGVGTTAGGPIPLRRPDGSVSGYKTDASGKVVTTRLQEEALAKIAEATHGIYVAATPGGGEIGRIADAIDSMEDREMQQKLLTRYEERFQIPLAFGLLCLLAEAMIPDRRRRRAAPRGALGRAAAAFLLALGAIAGTPPASAASPHELVEKGNESFKAGKYDDALRYYTEAQVGAPNSPQILLNIGNVFYRKGDFEKAREAYRRAWNARDRSLAESARYNAGTAGLAGGKYDDAVDDFRQALRLKPDDAEARKNLELALMRLKQQKQQQQQQSPQGKKSKDQKQQQQQEKGSQGQEQKSPAGQDQKDQKQKEQEARAGKQEKDQKGAAAAKADKKEKEQAERILDALKGEDKPRVDPGRERRPERKPEKDW